MATSRARPAGVSGPVIEGPWAPTSRARADPLGRRDDAEHAAPVATHVVERPRLHALLDRAVADAAVTLVVGPAGWGKTLLVGSWLASGAGGRQPAWVTLGPGHDDPRTFWTALARAVGPGAGPAATAALRRLDGVGDPEELPGVFARALRTADRPVVLVLDDLHEVTSPAVHAGLRSLVERPVPSLALVATTRRDPPWPLTRLRLAGLLAEIRPDDLAFRDDEAAALFAQLGVPADGGHVHEMVARTGGWAAGMRLAALDLATRPDVDAAVAAFSGDAHSVSGYLLEEVLDRQTPELLAFLEQVSAVDLVCADLADALTGRDDGAALLAELSASHLFVQALDHPGRWYRLHRLVLDLLRARPVPRRTRRDRDRRAAVWFRRHGMPLEALRSSVHGELWALAADVLAAHLVSLVLRGSAEEVARILGGVPHPVLLERPELATALAGARITTGDTTQVRTLVDAARRGAGELGEGRRQRLAVHHGLIEAARARVSGDLEALARAYRTVTLDVATLDRWGVLDAEIVPAVVLTNLGTAELWLGDLEAAEAHLRRTAEAAGSGGPPALPRVNAASHLALLACERGELDTAAARAREVIATATGSGWAQTPQVAPAYLAMARLTVDRDELSDTDLWLGRLADVEEIAPEPHVLLARSLVLASRRDAADDREEALERLRVAGARTGTWTPPRPLAEQWRLGEADLLARGGNPEAARALADRLGAPRTEAGRVAAALLRLHLGDEGVEHALGTTVASALPRVRVGACVVAAAARRRAGDPERALDLLEQALLAAAPDGLRRPFLAEPSLTDLLRRRIDRGSGAASFAVDLLERLTGTTPDPAVRRRALAEPLTEREATMLRYLASTLSNAEIAAELYVSLNTVKTHQRSVYRKLGATGRREAVRRARTLGLL
ncbi:LuxR C-terminal-related transcriptional regulator [Actinomycetospora cinnamomea]|uniref:LuxR family maltose regulon positive regulatory protein n=1 Tax=Actinomycetospora cinnamomea TaxID=663609 RepID=A0A2U1F069_9PSEU|nr:LuxR C-terminal-related transcriptional regulator [Actinomycetospora cinnamomea]PVZ05400.1 LuxR family maltose regulon positive regulatory protein [Actinomycetospora cinnamomea]